MAQGADRAHAMNVITPISPLRTWLKRVAFMAARARPGGLGGPPSVQFPRWVIVKRNQWPDLGQGKQQNLRNDHLLFYGQFDGSWKRSIEAISHGVPGGPKLFANRPAAFDWLRRLLPFKRYVVHNQSDTEYCYNALAGLTEGDVKRALRVRAALRALAARHGEMTPEAFALAYRGALLGLKGCLGGSDHEPVATAEPANGQKADNGNDWAEAS